MTDPNGLSSNEPENPSSNSGDSRIALGKILASNGLPSQTEPVHPGWEPISPEKIGPIISNALKIVGEISARVPETEEYSTRIKELESEDERPSFVSLGGFPAFFIPNVPWAVKKAFLDPKTGQVVDFDTVRAGRTALLSVYITNVRGSADGSDADKYEISHVIKEEYRTKPHELRQICFLRIHVSCGSNSKRLTGDSQAYLRLGTVGHTNNPSDYSNPSQVPGEKIRDQVFRWCTGGDLEVRFNVGGDGECQAPVARVEKSYKNYTSDGGVIGDVSEKLEENLELFAARMDGWDKP